MGASRPLLHSHFRLREHFSEHGRYDLYIFLQGNSSSHRLEFNFLQQEFAADANIRKFCLVHRNNVIIANLEKGKVSLY